MARTIITGSDKAHYDLVTDLLTSLTDVGRDGFDVGHLTWITKDQRFSLGDGGPEITLRYCDIRPLLHGR